MSSEFSKQIEEIGKLPAAEPVYFSKETETKELTVAEKRILALSKK